MTTDALIGTEVGRFRVERLLGQGGMGAVYLGVQPAIGSRVAIKVLSADCARDPRLLERFFAEARSVNLIRHEGIVSVLDLAQLPDGRPYIVMEFVEGQTLGDLVRTASPLPIGGVVSVITEVLVALDAAHKIGIIHRDLKPENIIVTREGHAKVLDFGIAKLAPGLTNDNSPRTATGALLGTPAYMAPEQISGAQNVDARTDIYAAGVVLYECVTGVAPFSGETLFDLMRAHLELTPLPPSQRRADLLPAIESVILTALAKDPLHRFQSATAMSEALRLAAMGLSGEQWRTLSGKALAVRPSLQHLQHPNPTDLAHGQTQPATTQPRPLALPDKTEATRSSRAGLVIALGLLCATAVAITALVLTRSEKPPTAVPIAVSEPPSPPPPDAAVATTLDAAPVSAPAAPTPAQQPPTAKPPTPAPPPAQTPNPVARPPVTATTTPSGETEVLINGTLRIGEPVEESKLRRKPATYNAKQFDGKTFASQALAIAREMYADAGLVSMEFTPVAANGLTDLTAEDASAEYMFRSPSHKGECYVEVTARPKQIIARIRDHSGDPKCARALRPIPRCSLAGVWKKAPGTRADQRLKISFLEDGTWFVSNIGADDNLSETIRDTCP